MIVHSHASFLHFAAAEIPRVPNKDKVKIDKLGAGFYKITVSYGFIENPGILMDLTLVQRQNLDFPLMKAASFWAARSWLYWRPVLFLFGPA
jgi:KUP system potassium uptake protein